MVNCRSVERKGLAEVLVPIVTEALWKNASRLVLTFEPTQAAIHAAAEAA
jgi:hypothetical protein